MKKIWYLRDKKSNDSKAVKLFLYEKNGLSAGKMDLSAFWEDGKEQPVILRFQGPGGAALPGWTETELQTASSVRTETDAQTAFSGRTTQGESFSQGKGQLEGRLAKALAEMLAEAGGEVQLSVTAGEKCYVSDGWIFRDTSSRASSEEAGTVKTEKAAQERLEAREAEETAQERAEAKETEKAAQERLEAREAEETAQERSEEAETAAEELLPEDGAGRRYIQLDALEDEMAFRKLAHNSFLLHGYYNYGHIVIDESDEEARLGVPGNYYKREQMVAEMFGFPSFEPARDGEQVKTGTFGYYYTSENKPTGQ